MFYFICLGVACFCDSWAGLYSKLLAFFSLFLLNIQGGEELPDLPSSEADPGILPTEIRTLVERRKQVSRALLSFKRFGRKSFEKFLSSKTCWLA